MGFSRRPLRGSAGCAGCGCVAGRHARDMEGQELVGGRKLVGTYYGYVMTLNDNGASQMRAHYATKRFLDAHPVDFVMSPQAYPIRRLGGTCGDMKPFKSFTDHGIVSVIENDTRTHNITSRRTQLLTEEQSVAALRRDMGIALCRCQCRMKVIHSILRKKKAQCLLIGTVLCVSFDYSLTPPAATPPMMNLERIMYTTVTGIMEKNTAKLFAP